MTVETGQPGMGWLPDYPDFRDYTPMETKVSPRSQKAGQKEGVRSMLEKAGAAQPGAKPLPPAVDLRQWCSPIEHQETLGSCSAHAGVGLVEYFERRAFGRHIDASRLFLYKATRNLLNFTGDTGAFLRSTMGALVLFGVPPEQYWPYNVARFEDEPPAFCYAFAQSYQALSYYRLDPPGTAKPAVLAQIKTHLAAGLPAMFGFTVFASIAEASTTGRIPFPTPTDKIQGGHAVDAVGYDDALKIRSPSTGGMETTGAFLIRNSWGTGWGEAGYGWLPYDYVLRNLSEDWWALLKSEWIDTGAFQR